MRRRCWRLFAALSLTLLVCDRSVRSADRYAVVVNSESKLTRIERDDLARVFLGKKTLWEESSTRIMPALLEDDNELTQGFLESTLKKSVSQYRAYWKRLLFSGGGTAPKTFRNSAQVLEFVARQPGGIGIIEAGAVESRVKVLEILN